MAKRGKRVLSLAVALVMALGASLPMPAAAAAPSVTVNTTTIAFAGHEWVVIGDETSGVGDIAGTGAIGTGNAGYVTLLLKNGDAGFTGYTSTLFGNNSCYDGSGLQTAMNGIYAAIGASNSLEQALIVPRTLNEIANTSTWQPTETLGSQYVWPLSGGEHGKINDISTLSYNGIWWLRSPEPGINFLALVGLSGGGLDHVTVYSPQLAVRPAFILNLSSVLFTSAAAGGKPGTAGQWSSADPLQTTDTLKFTMKDANLSLTDVVATDVTGNTITFSYTATASGSSTYNALSAVIYDDNNNLKQYCRLENNPSGNTASVTVPDGLAATDKLYVFIEQANYNSDPTNPANFTTDFASELKELTRAAPQNLAGVACTTAANNDGQITGTDATMEYSADDGTTWKPCTVNPTTGLANGSYQVRYSGKVNGIQAVTASPEANVTVDAYTAPATAPTVGNVTAPTAVNEGQALTLTTPNVTDNGAAVSAQGWQISANGTDGWAAFAPGTAMTTAHNGQHLRYYATNSKGTGYSPNTVQIKVNDVPSQAQPGNNEIDAPSKVEVNKAFVIIATGDLQDIAGTVVGSTKFVPYSWSVNPSGTFPVGGPYTASVTLTEAKDYTLTVTYRLERWNGTAWVDTGETDTKTSTITAQAASTSTPPSSGNPPAPGSTGAGGSPQTGDSNHLGLWILLAASTLALLGGLWLLQRRNKANSK